MGKLLRIDGQTKQATREQNDFILMAGINIAAFEFFVLGLVP